MPGTYTPKQALDLVRHFVHGIPVDEIDSQVCDIINSTIWTAYPWPWSRKSLTAITLTNAIQDQGTTPTDFLRLVNARLVRTDVTPNQHRELIVTSFLAPELALLGGLETIRMVAHEPISGKFRLDKAASVTAPVVLKLEGEYQKAETRITEGTMETAFEFPDRYFGVFVEGLKWKLYQLSDDPRAGNVAIDREGRKQYTGQLAVFHDALQSMLRAEDVADAQQFEFPEQSLGPTTPGHPGIFGGW